MSVIETVSGVKNACLSRRELTCNFAGLGGRLKKLEAIDMDSKAFKLDSKIIIPINMTSHVGKRLMTGTFYVYDDEALARKQVSPVVFARLDKAKKKAEDAAAEDKKAEDAAAEDKKAEDAAAEDKKAEDAAAAAEEQPAKEEKS